MGWQAVLRDALEMVRVGRMDPIPRTPYRVELRDSVVRLRHYAGEGRTKKKRPSLLLVPPLMIAADVYDITPQGSAVAALLADGVDPWVVDFGAPEHQEGGLRRTLSDHVLAVSRAADRVREVAGRDVHLAGYSQGGMFCYQTAAYRRSEGIASLVTFGSPVDVQRELLPGLPDRFAADLLENVGKLVLNLPLSRSSVPAWLSRTGFKLLSPAKELRNQIDFLLRLRDRDSRREGQRRFLAREGWVAWPGPALREFVEQFLVNNRLFSGGFVIEGRTLSLADITCAVLTFVGETDEIARPGAVRSIREAAPHAELYEAVLHAGHFGLVVGTRALDETWPIVGRWLRWREHGGRRPNHVRPPANAAATKGHVAGDHSDSTSLSLEVAQDVYGLLRDMVGSGGEFVSTLAAHVRLQLPRLMRLGRVRRDTRIGLALSLAEQAAAAPDSTCFLFRGRAYTYAEANRRVDAVVRGLLSLGIRQGEHVGIYMDSRPSALALSTAVNRLGAVAIFLRPDGDLRRELDLSEVQHLIADPDHATQACAVWPRRLPVLGGGPGPKTLPENAFDMEAIDPDEVAVPEWYEPSPGLSQDVTFVFLSGRGLHTHTNRITNRRWALSALGTASAGALSPRDTLYCWTPIQHPTGLLVSISAAMAAGARVAVANGFSARTFWEEVRRYGATVVFYTGTMCRELVAAPPDSAERNHPVRLFAGSGMPRGIWRRLVERFGPVSVLEFYASTEGNAILANITGEKVGSVGRPLPGGTEVAVAAYDLKQGELVEDAAGFARHAHDEEIGVLLARVDRERGALEGRPLRSIFEKGDAWHDTGDLVRHDADGDFWLVDHVADLIHDGHGYIPTIPIEEALWEIEGVSAVAAYGLRLEGSRTEIPAVAIVLDKGAALDPARVKEVVRAKLDRRSRPVIVQDVDKLPLTAGYRVRKQPLRDHRLGAGDLNGRIWFYDRKSRAYRPLDETALTRLRRRLTAQEHRPRRPRS